MAAKLTENFGKGGKVKISRISELWGYGQNFRSNFMDASIIRYLKARIILFIIAFEKEEIKEI